MNKAIHLINLKFSSKELIRNLKIYWKNIQEVVKSKHEYLQQNNSIPVMVNP